MVLDFLLFKFKNKHKNIKKLNLSKKAHLYRQANNIIVKNSKIYEKDKCEYNI